MATSVIKVMHCASGTGWCVESQQGISGPLESEDEANLYARLMNIVNAARTEIACTDEVCWQ